MKRLKLAVLILAAAASRSFAAFDLDGVEPAAQDHQDSGAAWKGIASCHFKIERQSPEGEPVEGQLDVYSMTPENSSIVAYRASLHFIQPETAPMESTDVKAQAVREKSQIDQFLSDDGGRALAQSARIPADKMTEIAAIESYDMDHSDDGSRAVLFVFKDKDGNILGRAGMTGWIPFGCDPK